MAVDSPLTGWGTPDSDTENLPLNYASARLEKSAVVKTGPGYLYGVTVTNTKASAQYFLLFDASTLPADGAIPLLAKSIPAGDATGFAWLPARAFNVGIIVCNSTTQATKTIGAADCIFDCQYL